MTTTTSLVVLCLVLVFIYKEWGVRLTTDGFRREASYGHPPRVQAGSDSFRFEEQQLLRPRTPVAYDPCRPIHVVVNDRLAPADGAALLRGALRRVSAATGMSFVVDGSTNEQPTTTRPTRDLQRYGRGWSPVLVAWTTPRRVPRLAGTVVGLGGSTAVPDSFTSMEHYVTGTVSLDAPSLKHMLARPDGAKLVRAVMMHELGHVVGLAHVHDVRELMNPKTVGRTSFGPGDLEGLAELGAARCFR